jgi:hypothetical protein
VRECYWRGQVSWSIHYALSSQDLHYIVVLSIFKLSSSCETTNYLVFPFYRGKSGNPWSCEYCQDWQFLTKSVFDSPQFHIVALDEISNCLNSAVWRYDTSGYGLQERNLGCLGRWHLINLLCTVRSVTWCVQNNFISIDIIQNYHFSSLTVENGTREWYQTSVDMGVCDTCVKEQFHITEMFRRIIMKFREVW